MSNRNSLISDRFTQAIQAKKTLNRLKDTIEPEATLKLVNEGLQPYHIYWNNELKEFELETITNWKENDFEGD